MKASHGSSVWAAACSSARTCCACRAGARLVLRLRRKHCLAQLLTRSDLSDSTVPGSSRSSCISFIVVTKWLAQVAGAPVTRSSHRYRYRTTSVNGNGLYPVRVHHLVYCMKADT